MTDVPAASPPRSAGALLSAEREKQGLSRADVAQRLCMSVSQVEALESGDFSRLAPGPFVRGFARNYARVLGLDAESVVGLIQRDLPSTPPPALAVPSQGIQFDPFGRKWTPAALRASIVAALVLVASVGSLYWWLNVYPAKPVPVAAPSGSAPPAELPGLAPPIGNGAPAEVAPLPAPAVAPAPAAPAASEAPPPQPVNVAAARPASPGGLARLRFVTQERTWVEIIDGSGERVASRHIEPGNPSEFLGRPPLRVAIGNAPAVRLTFNDREVDLAQHTRAAVARFTLE